MAHIDNTKVYDRKVNFSCLLIALALLVLAIFGYSTTLTEFDIAGFGTETLTDFDPEVFGNMIQADPSIVIKMIFFVVVAIMQFIALINVIRLTIGWFGFIGKKDSRKMAKKLSKHAKITFGTLASIFVIHMYTSFDTGSFTEEAKKLFVITFIAAGILYVATRYYRWFVVEKESYKYYTFVLIRDAMFIGLCIMIYSLFVSPTVIGDLLNNFSNMIPAMESENSIIMSNALLAFFDSIIALVLFFFVTGVFKVALKYLPFDNYKRPAYKRAGGKFITISIFTLLLLAARAATVVLIGNEGSFDSTLFVDTLLENLDLFVKMVLLAIGIHVLGIVDSDEELGEVKVAAPKAAAEDAPAEEN